MRKYGLVWWTLLLFFWMCIPVGYITTKIGDRDMTMKDAWSWYWEDIF